MQLTVRPNFPYRLTYFRGEVFWCMIAVAHSQKNLVNQLRSSRKTVYFFGHWVDLAGCLEQGLEPSSFTGTDLMSDRQAANVLNPYFLINESKSSVDVPWTNKGFLLINCTCALIHSGTLHKLLSIKQRCENALAGYILLDLARIAADTVADTCGVPRGF